MTIEATIQSALGTLVSGRCYPLIAPDSVAKPYIIYQIISDVQFNDLDGFAGLSQKRCQIDVYHTSYGAVKTLAASIKTSMATALSQSVHLSSRDLHETDTQLYRISMDFSVWG